ncbi:MULTISPECIES: hypothetical protein [unclassified Photobacterium]|uniref:hypothetical protein n=1 Tax=unclassified Photobacterium TaxID=2628852 RepID=UPI001EE14CFB|nr:MULTISPECIES: hypothetical protein [unclassified Photobacterium]MCG3864090.1 hypothetical protein [Photobacterium sp. Ph6]MCG3875620.1 hypothetical protein [Photobacterium sp. Ph5]
MLLNILILIVSLIFTFLTFVIFRDANKKFNVLNGFYSYLTPLLFIQIGVFTYIGSYVAFFFKDNIGRLYEINYSTISLSLLYITYSVLVLVSILSFYFYFINKSNSKKNTTVYNLTKEMCLLNKTQIYSIFIIVLLYVFYKYAFNYNNSPIIAMLSGMPERAAELRFLIQTHQISVDVKYLSKLVEIFGFYLVSYLYINVILFRQYFKTFLLSFFLVSLNIVYDGQKAPLILLMLSLLLIRYIYTKKIKELAMLSIAVVVLLLVMNLLASGSSSILSIVFTILDRTFIGQNQGLYYILQYLPVNHKDFFDWLINSNYIPVDREVIPFIGFYAGNNAIVNVNTYYLAEAWYAFGIYGILISPVIASLFIIFYMYIMDHFLRRNYLLYFPFAFFISLSFPISRSFYQILDFKYFLYVFVFGIIPFYTLISLKRHNNVT